MTWADWVQQGDVAQLSAVIMGLPTESVLPLLRQLPTPLGQQVVLACGHHPHVDDWIGDVYPNVYRVGGQLVGTQPLPQLMQQLRTEWIRWMESDIELGVFLGHIDTARTLHHGHVRRWLAEQMVALIQSTPMDSPHAFQQHLKCHWMAHGWAPDDGSLLDPLLDTELSGLAALPSLDWLGKVTMQFPMLSIDGLYRHNRQRLQDGSVAERNRSLGLQKRWLELAKGDRYTMIKLVLLMHGESVD